MKTLVFAAMFFVQAAPQQRIQPGVITGQVRMVDGSPAVGIRVAALLVTETAGQGAGSMVSALAQTDDAGRYRLENVLPGRYYIIAGFVEYPTYYPGVKTRDESRIVTIEPGSTVAIIDFTLARPVGVRVSGRMTGIPAAGLPPGLFSVVLQFTGTPSTRLDGLVQSDGSFEFPRVAPGTYTVRLLPGTAGLPTIAVDDKDITGLEFVAPRLLAGRVVVEGGGSLPLQAAALATGVPDPPALLRFQARRTDTRQSTPAAIIRSDGTFLWPLPVGEYEIFVTLMPIGYYVKSMSDGSANLFQQSLKVTNVSDSEIHVTLTKDSTPYGVTVSGRLTGLPEGTSGPRWISIQSVEGTVAGATGEVSPTLFVSASGKELPIVGNNVLDMIHVYSVGSPLNGLTEIRVGETLLRADGSFEIPNVPPGTYMIHPFPSGPAISFQRIIVADRDLSGIELRFAPSPR